jgi:predicted hydrolase (HD superfamily)
MLTSAIERGEALKLLMAYNKESFHILHGLTVSGVMAWYAKELGFGEEVDFWSITGLLHDIDYGMFPDQHCVKAVDLLKEASVGDDMIYSICSHGYKICSEVEPKHMMEKVLYASDELTGLIGAAVRMRPSQSAMDLELSSMKKKFKDKRFAAGCSRDIIEDGAAMLGWTLEELMEKTILAMRSCEVDVNDKMKELGLI